MNVSGRAFSTFLSVARTRAIKPFFQSHAQSQHLLLRFLEKYVIAAKSYLQP
jgi:hypothetical protein